MIACVLIPAFELRAALRRTPALALRTAALAPVPGSEQLLGPVRAEVEANAVRPDGSPLAIVRSALGDQVGIVGAAAIVFDRIASGLMLAHG